MACAVAVVVTHRQRVLFGKRPTKSTGFEWQLPGGWIEPGESPQQAALREVLEETGLTLEAPEFVAITSNLFSPRDHSITLYFEAECVDPEALSVRESSKCLGWYWRDWLQLTEGLYLPLRMLKNTNYRPFLQDRRQTYVSI